ncbi:Period circadian protein, putative isoform 1 [Hibiscus syriacus]|uniref:Period circadian protein, putative isoform 1 n=1 Tax=Hibiscus syriacus TaxID=106335 RepID=A0A6A2X1R5_HIBSY|nr:Period circadian protein, putative isoform 1 [Hibiscus syriacus]
MASKLPDEPPCDTQGTDEESIALRRKRLRRVSFADREITSVHIFKRDDDYETPSDSTPEPANERENEVMGLFKGLVDSDDDEDGLSSGSKSFFRPMETPSPCGSSTVGSATSNDEDNFFGPVSAEFIRPGRLSDSAASDDNHDITMDSTAFSMHFHSIARSEPGDLNTSTGVPPASEEKTPFQATTSSDRESLMVLTKVGKLKSPSPVPIDTFSGGRDSNDMSLVGESMHRYDYGKLCPTLEALLVEGSEFNTIPTDPTIPKSSMVVVSHGNGNECMESSHSELCVHDDNDLSSKGISSAQNKLVEATSDSATTLTEDFVDHQIPNQHNEVDNKISEVWFGTSVLNSESISITNGTPVNQSSEAVQLDLVKHFENENQLPTEDGLKENSPQDKIRTHNIDHASGQLHKSPLAGSIHSLSAKRQQILLDATNAPKRSLFVTPSPKQSGSVLRKGSIKEGGSVASIPKSNSELKVPEPSSGASAFKEGAAKSKLGLSESFSTSACSFDTIMEEMIEGLQRQQETAPTNNLEKFSGVGLKQGVKDCTDPGTAKNSSSLGQDGETTGLAEDKKYNDKATDMMAKTTSPSNFTLAGQKVTNHSLISVDYADSRLVASAFNSSPKAITHEFSKDKRDTDRLYKHVFPLVNRLNEKLSSPMGHKRSLYGDLKLEDQDNSAVIVSKRECNSVETVPSSNNLTAISGKRTPPSAVVATVKIVNERGHNGLDLQNTFSTSKNFHDGATLKLPSGGPQKNIQTTVEKTCSSEYFVEEQRKVSSVYASPGSHTSKIERSPQKRSSRKRQTQSPTSKEPSLSPCRKEMHNALYGDNMQLSVAKDVVSLNCSSNVQRIDDCHGRSNPSPVQDIQSSSKRKRTSEEIAIVDVHHSDNSNVMQKSPKFCKVGEKNMEHTSEYSCESNLENERIDGGKILMNWTDVRIIANLLHFQISLKLSADTNQQLSPCFDKLNLKMINMLEDKLIHQQKVYILEMLCSEIQSQHSSAYNQSCNILHKRVAETRRVLCRIVYGKAKLQLMHVKRERLLVELLRTGVRESQMLKLNFVKHHSASSEKDTKLGDNSCSVTFGNTLKGASGKIGTMKDELEGLEEKIKNLTKSFHICCKIKGELSSSGSGTIELVNDHLKKRTSCRFIRQGIQLWEVNDLQNRSGHYNVILNYHGFICQSLALNTGRNSSVFVANKLNDMNIIENFPNMDACSAFHFVFHHESTKKYVGPKSLAQETQRTGSLLRNLLDVVEEVQVARLEIRNMTLASFHSPSAKQLDLQLSFVDFESGTKVTMTLDVTCLNCGVYPSDILPYSLQTPATGTKNLKHQALSAEIKPAVENLRAGYLRIIRLCRCVSQVMQSSGRR